jgi:acyl-CoA thioesterase-1
VLFNGIIAGVASPAAARSGDKVVKIVAFGDSLTAGYRLKPTDAFPAQLEAALRARGHKVEVVNAGVSGDTTAAGLDRFAWAVPTDADGVIVELGANDALRGLSPAKARENLDRILTMIRAQKQEILLAGMQAPRNLPRDYVSGFDTIFPDLAAKHGALLYPFFLERIVMKAQFNLDDGIHPNAKGVAEIVTGILPKAEELLARIKAKRAGG